MNVLGLTYDQLIEKAEKRGYENELKYFGCSQAVVSALIETFGIGNADLLRASTALAGGIARRGNVCGALVGGILFIGLLVGRDDMEIIDQYERGQQYGGELYKRFEVSFGTTICADIQKKKFGKAFDMLTPAGRSEFIQSGAHAPDGCPAVTAKGARLTAELMVEILKEGRAIARLLATV